MYFIVIKNQLCSWHVTTVVQWSMLKLERSGNFALMPICLVQLISVL